MVPLCQNGENVTQQSYFSEPSNSNRLKCRNLFSISFQISFMQGTLS